EYYCETWDNSLNRPLY
nr:immunoglobulin light chain junction region [Macaca mulatta]MOW58377.1 immunoglobulin light chain junction region [Macaca mulatta]MOW59826.1 immunoglobulin light chain junction region [Macaca mulatta]MOW60141.1 immunoglobulin light chain junction region [Macaca mulatta]MOW60566.1 immunoglobulin light chain junction region [Macaca mulatta]